VLNDYSKNDLVLMLVDYCLVRFYFLVRCFTDHKK